jgi:hypothetical protein
VSPPRPRVRRVVALAAGVALLAAGCGLPQRKDTFVVTKPGASQASAQAVVAGYNAVRRRADATLDGSLLARAEGGALLDIDQGSYFVSVRVDEPGEYPQVRLAPPERVVAPRFRRYPLWFAVLARDRTGGTKRVAVFERADSVSPWRMVMAPETIPGAGLPRFARDRDGGVLTVAPGDTTGTGVSPATALRRYADALAPGRTADDAFFAPDAFLARTRAFQRSQQSLPYAGFRQTWRSLPPRYALRVAGGGVLVFGTLTRTDAYSVQANSYIDWADTSDTAAYLPGRVYRSAVLDYSHQVLMFLPAQGQGSPRLIGQYGGVVDGEGY